MNSNEKKKKTAEWHKEQKQRRVENEVQIRRAYENTTEGRRWVRAGEMFTGTDGPTDLFCKRVCGSAPPLLSLLHSSLSFFFFLLFCFVLMPGCGPFPQSTFNTNRIMWLGKNVCVWLLSGSLYYWVKQQNICIWNLKSLSPCNEEPMRYRIKPLRAERAGSFQFALVLRDQI